MSAMTQDSDDTTQEAIHAAWMDKALEMAQEAYDALEVPVGCVFVRNNQIIAKGRNRTTELRNATRHAELEAIDEILSSQQQSNEKSSDKRVQYPLVDIILYVTVEPCIMCASALRQLGIAKVYYGCTNERFGATGNGSINIHTMNHPVHPPVEVHGGVKREEAIMILRKFYVRENANAPTPRKKANRVLKTEILPP